MTMNTTVEETQINMTNAQIITFCILSQTIIFLIFRKGFLALSFLS